MSRGGRIDRATGRRMRDQVLPVGKGKPAVFRPERRNGSIVPGGRLSFMRQKVTRGTR